MAIALRDAITRSMKDIQQRELKWMSFIAAMRDIEMVVLKMKQNLFQFQQSLNIAGLGKLSTTLVPPHNLTDILSQIAKEPVCWVLQKSKIYIFCYQVEKVHACSTTSDMRLFIDIPFKCSDRYFEVYRPYSLPFYHDEIQEYVSVKINIWAYLSVAENKQLSSVLTPEDMNRYKEGYYTVCPADSCYLIILQNIV